CCSWRSSAGTLPVSPAAASRSEEMGRAAPALLAALAVLVVVVAAAAPIGELVLIDDFETANGWTVVASPGSKGQLVWERDDTGAALRLDYQLATGGFVILRKEGKLPLPENFAFSFPLRGDAPRSTFAFKAVDPDGNAGGRRWSSSAFPRAWQPRIVRRSRLAFAWGPANGGGPREARAIGIAGDGGGGAPGPPGGAGPAPR